MKISIAYTGLYPFIHNLNRKEEAMSSWQDGYDKGYEDGLNDRSSFTEGMQDFLGMLIDTALSVTEAEEEWRSGYREGYEAGERAREENL